MPIFLLIQPFKGQVPPGSTLGVSVHTTQCLEVFSSTHRAHDTSVYPQLQALTFPQTLPQMLMGTSGSSSTIELWSFP